MTEAREIVEKNTMDIMILNRAFRQNDLKKVKQILKTNKSININTSLIKDGFSYSLLHIAITVSKSPKIIEELINYGADINIYDLAGYTILSSTIINNLNDIATVLINLGANVNQPNKNGAMPLYCAIKHNNSEIAIKLINAGANINYIRSEPIEGENIFAMFNSVVSTTHKKMKLNDNQIEIIKELITNNSSFDCSMLMEAIRYQNIEIMMALIDAKADINYQNGFGMDALQFAISSGNISILNALLQCESIELPNVIYNNKSSIKRYYDGFYNKVCNVCNTDHKLKRCSACNIVGYCSKECQKKDWKQHKISCKLFALR